MGQTEDSLGDERRRRSRGGNGWRRLAISCIEDLSDAVYGAGLEAMQMSRAPVTGSLAFAERDGVLYTTGLIQARVALAGPLSEDKITLGVGLRLGSGSRHWLNEVATGDCGVFLPGDSHDSLYTPGTLYATVTLSEEWLERAAEQLGLVLDTGILGGTGVHARRIADNVLAGLRARYRAIHAESYARPAQAPLAGEALLEAAISHFARPPRPQTGNIDPRGHARIVARARAYVAENLEHPLSVEAIARAAFASRRTLHRAFNEVLDESPQSYVRKLRLHRIRRDLAAAPERACTIALVANRWGIGELGRLSGWYRELFGELPSATLARHTPEFDLAA